MTRAVRPLRPEDVAGIVALGAAFDRALTGTADWSEEDLVHDWRALADPERDAWVVEDAGAVVGYATFQDDGEGTFAADGYVHPDRFGQGVGSTLVGLAEARAAEQLEAVPLPRVVLQNTVLHVDAGARALLEGRGYRPVRHFLRMQIDMAGPPPEPAWPDGVVATAFRPDADTADVHACVHEAFAHEWSFRAETLADWTARKLDDPRFDPSLWVVAWAGEDVCGVALCTAGQFDMGFVNSLAVRPVWRRRGLGLALLHQAFAGFWERGERRVGLGVDAENPTDAVRLYERAGMRPVWQADVYEKVLRGG
ncbi:MAG TPA: GNAT family N-acetyltransferase [Gaiellales bacterium]|nr:GNAT family N-acetyltransferase [Gaiellales bacterium]